MKTKHISRVGLLLLCLALLMQIGTLSVAAETVSTEYYLSDGWDRVLLDTEVVTAMDRAAAAGGSLTIDVRDLAEEICYVIYLYEGDLNDPEEYGAVYIIEDTYYYLNYPSLGNQHFDADGNFSYRSGEVTLTKVEDMAGPLSAAALRISQGGEIQDFSRYSWGEQTMRVLFWICLAFLGFVVPVFFLVLGLMLSRSKKLGYPRDWRFLSGIAVVWMLLSLVLVILLLLA